MDHLGLFEVTKTAQHMGKEGHQIDRRPSFQAGPAGIMPLPEHNMKNINQLPDKLLLHIFTYLHHADLCQIAVVCKKWRAIAYDSTLWQRVSLRPDHSGLSVNNIDSLISLISNRFGHTLRYIELSCELIQGPVLHELSNKCPNLKHLTLDFASAMQLHDFNDLNAFPCNLKNLTICLSEVIFMEGFMRKVYQSLSCLEVLHLIGTFEQGDEEEEEIYEVINISKIKAHTPNLRVVNLYGISFVDDSHVELLSSNCIHLECLALNFCLRVKGTTLKVLTQRCKKLRTLLLHHCGVEDAAMRAVEWENSAINELDLTSTELSAETLQDILLRMPGFQWLGLGYSEFFNDKILEELLRQGKLENIRAMDLSHTVSLSENAILQLIRQKGPQLQGLMLGGKPKLAEQFFLNVIPFLKNIKVLSIGTAYGWFLRLSTRVHIDQIVICLSQHCTNLIRLEVQWDPDTIRYSDNSSKFIDQLRIRSPWIRSLTLSDGEYYEMVKSNFERSDRMTVVRTTTNYTTSIVCLLNDYKDLIFN
ncbi:hypothetical protein CAPTEDRAFT_167812 [Capitella teleta]|uniref:F-box domain-containing protein n=1 Tax=Capitella teleta TaxID=283909 RepID=R7U3F4_CAPTE|nr:hypothetical protein CAPTEDRAFT_167812 [Capitella teleta]|eukprot:ELT97705.1 hypothetical protein CAPTEDRAFT_167812 [Capitella teleta]